MAHYNHQATPRKLKKMSYGIKMKKSWTAQTNPRSQRKRPKELYLASSGNAFKIGISSNPASRMGDLQIGCPLPVVLHRAYAGKAMGSLESYLHQRFRDHRVHGEWFKIAVLPIVIDYLDNQLELVRNFEFNPSADVLGLAE